MLLGLDPESDPGYEALTPVVVRVRVATDPP